MSTFEYEHLLATIPDYPKPGILFRDITPVLADPKGLEAVIKAMAEPFKGMGVTKVVGSEARGFIFGAPLALELGAGFVPARKPGKLPREVRSQEYDLEYGTDSLEVHLDAFEPGDVVLVADDLIATGGTAVATGKLVRESGATLAGMSFFIKLNGLGGYEAIGQEFPGVKIASVIEIDE